MDCVNTATTLPIYLVLLIVICLFVIVSCIKFLNITDKPEMAEICYHTAEENNNNTIKSLINQCHMLKQMYEPPTFWGKNGHMQTMLYGLLKHRELERKSDRRCMFTTKDGSTASFDIFEPKTSSEGAITLVICPGFASSSLGNSVRTCVHHAVQQGIRCVVLNHIGVLDDVPVTGTRLFSYVSTEEFGGMVDRVLQEYGNTRLVFLGYSMGACIISRYLAVDAQNHPQKEKFLCFMSICQAYDATTGRLSLEQWRKCRRLYLFGITCKMQHLLNKNYDKVVAPLVHAGTLADNRVCKLSTDFDDFDELYTRRVHGFPDTDSFYKHISSFQFLHLGHSVLTSIVYYVRRARRSSRKDEGCTETIISIPSIFLNALDDPIVPKSQWKPVKLLSESRPNIAFVLTKHGGHLSFLEGSSLKPSSVRWIDKLVIQVAKNADNL